jgi:hypothetical protein
LALGRARRLHHRYEKSLAIAEAMPFVSRSGTAFLSHLTAPEFRSWSQDLARYRAGKLVERVPAAERGPPSSAD